MQLEEPFAPLAGRSAHPYMAKKGQGVPCKQEAYREAVPPDGAVGHGPEPQHLQAGQGGAPQDLQVPVEEP